LIGNLADNVKNGFDLRRFLRELNQTLVNECFLLNRMRELFQGHCKAVLRTKEALLRIFGRFVNVRGLLTGIGDFRSNRRCVFGGLLNDTRFFFRTFADLQTGV
jgi:hypothetical protein